jgi:iron complex outermembrane receptor protein
LNRRILPLLTRVSLGALALGSAGRALAAPAQVADQAANTTAAQGQVAEVVVTAQRRNQRLQDVGIAVTAVTSVQMRQLGITSSKDISKIAPGVLLDSTAGGGVNANLTIRGISQSDFSSIQESPNSIYIDDVYLSSPNAAAFSLYDLDRIEVLRGPQGTLFGRASSGGLANFIVAKPTRDFTGYIEAGYSSYNDAYVEAAASGPITDKLRFRISGRRETADGWFQNGLPGGSAAFEKDFYGVRGQLEADVTPDLTARFSLSYDADPTHHEGGYRAAPAYLVNGQPELLPANIDAYGTGPGNDITGYRNPYSQYNKSAFNSSVGHLQNERFSPTLYLTQKLGADATLTSITNYTKFGFSYSEDCDGGPVNFCTDQLAQHLEQWSEELRLNGKRGPLTYTGGFYYLNTRQKTPQGFDFPALSGTPFAFDDVNEVRQHTDSWAIFGQAEYRLTDTLSATVGVRYTNEHKDFDSKVYFSELGSFYGGPGVIVPPLLTYDFSKETVGDLASHDEGLWSGKVELDYKPNRDMLFYASVSRGVKAAGYNTNLGGGLTTEQTPFKSEYLYAYEVGSKLDLLDHHVRFNTSIFYYDEHRFQGFGFSGVQGVVGNYNGYFTGAETELIVAPRRDVDLSISASNLLTKLYDVPTAYSGVRDEQSIMAPRWTVQLSATKRFELPFGTLALNWNGNYIDARYASVDNNNATYIPGSFVHNARLSLDMEDKGLELAFFVDNISNASREQFQYDLTTTTGGWIRAYAPPRWIGGSIRKSF